MKEEEPSLADIEKMKIFVRGCRCSERVERRNQQGRLAWCNPRESLGDVQAAEFSAAFFVGFYEDMACAVWRIGRR